MNHKQVIDAIKEHYPEEHSFSKREIIDYVEKLEQENRCNVVVLRSRISVLESRLADKHMRVKLIVNFKNLENFYCACKEIELDNMAKIEEMEEII